MTDARVCEILTLFHGGASLRRIARTLRIGRQTVRRVLEQVEHARSDGPEQRPAQPEKRRPSQLDAFETTIADLLTRYPKITIKRVREELRRSGYTGGHTILHQRIRALRPRPEEESRQWMLRVLQSKERSDNLRPLVISDEDLRIFVDTLRNGKLKDRNRVLAVLAHRRGISSRSISRFLHLSRRSISSYCSIYKLYGCARLFKGFHDRLRKSDDELLQNTLFSV